MTDIKTIMTKLDEMNGVIRKAQTDLNNGKVANLSYLDTQVGKICEEAVKLPPAEAKQAQAPMANMIGNLETLALTLQSFQNTLKERTE